jgi:hypothetical protein
MKLISTKVSNIIMGLKSVPTGFTKTVKIGKIGSNLNFKLSDDQNRFRSVSPINRLILRFIGTEIDKPVQIQIFEKSFKKLGKILQNRENYKCSSEESFSNLHHLVG